MKKAFTLAEVLITLGIIGIVAAMTLPAITGHYRKKIVEVKLKRFYSTFSNILMRSEVDNETMQFWEWPLDTYKDDEGNIIQNGSISDYDWFLKYIKPYLNTQDVKTSFHLYCVWYDGFAIKFTDGTGVTCGIYEGGGSTKGYPFMCMFFPNANHIDDMQDDTVTAQNLVSGKDYFIFEVAHSNKKKGLIAPDSNECTGQKGTRYLPSQGCVKKIMSNNWEIPEDYPVQF